MGDAEGLARSEVWHGSEAPNVAFCHSQIMQPDDAIAAVEIVRGCDEAVGPIVLSLDDGVKALTQIGLIKAA